MMSVVDNLAVQVIEAVPTQPWKKPRSAQRRDLLTYLVLALLAYAIVMISGVAGPDGFALVFFVEVLLLTVLRSRGIGKAKSLNAIVSTVIGAGAVAAFPSGRPGRRNTGGARGGGGGQAGPGGDCRHRRLGSSR